MTTLATEHRPRRFEDVAGAADAVELMTALLTQNWRPPAILLSGPFGCGKTTLARLLARALLCETLEQGPQSPEPCGKCSSCAACEVGNHPDFIEIDAASHGGVAEVKRVVEELRHRSGSKLRILCFDECHALTQAGQNALLNVLEEGAPGLMFLFCTTDPGKMLRTVRSRCVDVPVRLLRVREIRERLEAVGAAAGIQAEEKALKLVASYARGHLRDALVSLEQLARMANPVTEAAARAFLRADKRDAVYKLLTEADPKAHLEKAEALLCERSFRELTDAVGEVLVDAYRLSVGVTDFPEVDRVWLEKIGESVGSRFLLPIAQRVIFLPPNPPTIQGAVAALVGTLADCAVHGVGSSPMQHTRNEAAAVEGLVPQDLRKPRP